MQAPIQIAFRHCAPSEKIRAEIERQARKLEQFSDRITSCRVVVEAPNDRHRSGGLYRVDIRLAMPDGKEIVVDRRQGEKREREHINVAIREAFDAAARQVDDFMHELRREVKVHDAGRLARVSKFVAGADYGFLQTDDGREVYFHRNAAPDGVFERLSVGSDVRFVEEAGEKGPQASSVWPIGKHRPA